MAGISTTFTFKTEGGQSPEKLVADIVDDVNPTVSDLLYVGQRHRSRVLQRTQRGVDFEEKAFAGYSTKRPYYWNPTAGKKGLSLNKRIAAVQRIMKKLSGRKTGYVRVFRESGKVVAEVRGHGDTIKFPSYAAFKQALGRTNVDLRGPRAPHMLQAIVVRVGATEIGNGLQSVPGDSTERASELRVGIYGPEAERASAHNTGTSRLPQRKFLGASDAEKGRMEADLVSRVLARIKKRFKS